MQVNVWDTASIYPSKIDKLMHNQIVDHERTCLPDYGSVAQAQYKGLEVRAADEAGAIARAPAGRGFDSRQSY